eukprot:gene439-473_t
MDIALQSSVYVSSPEYAGWLLKRGFHWRKLWKPRWVALHGAEIVYMDKEPTLENSSTMTITKAQITTASVIDREDIDGNPLGFAIHINDGHSPTWYLRAESARDKKSWLMRLNHVHAIVRWLEDFEKVKVLGVGGTGIVYELLHKTNGQRYAMKEMEIKNKAQMQMAVSEAEMLKDIMENVSHPSIMHIEKVFQVGSKFYLVFPLCTGGELYEHIIKKGHFTEKDAAVIMKDLISGLHALHSQDILHLDIKPENILFDGLGPDARIKITDFGLSKLFSENKGKETKARFSFKAMQDKLRAFAETGDLNRDRLRGTIGYMSPELILMGHVCKGTDVFAAGVVLYILLCGRPPFNSKSNREVLEKTCKGVYNMSGPEWDDISDEAKDLVRRMLVVNPDERISTDDILAHPWLKQLDEEVVNDDSSVSSAEAPPAPAFSQSSMGNKRKGTTNLANALRQLSGHVKQLRSEKLATNVTRLVSLMQQSGDKGKSSLSHKYLHPVRASNSGNDGKEKKDGASATVSESEAEFENLILDPEFRSALSKAWNSVAEEQGGRLTIEQMIALIRYSYSSQPVSPNSNVLLVPLLMCRFFDRDGDGYIDADDLFAAQALIIQRAESFLKIVFRIYTEAVWYPGRQLNLMHILQHTNVKGQVSPNPSNNSNNIISADTATDSNSYVVEPPKYITARHVAAVFEKLGYDASHAPTIFGILCEAINRVKAADLRVSDSDLVEVDEETLDCDVSAKLAASLSLNEGDVTASKLSPPQASPLTSIAKPEEEDADSSSGRPSRSSTTQTPANSSFNSNPNASAGNAARMDFNDFKKAVELDDILLQVIFRRSRARMMELMRAAENKYRQVLEEHVEVVNSQWSSGSGSDKVSDAKILRPPSREICKQKVFEDELKHALGPLKTSETTPKKSYPIASAVGRATFAALGLAAKVTSNIVEATVEATEPDHRHRHSSHTDNLASEFRKGTIGLDSDDDDEA